MSRPSTSNRSTGRTRTRAGSHTGTRRRSARPAPELALRRAWGRSHAAAAPASGCSPRFPKTASCRSGARASLGPGRRIRGEPVEHGGRRLGVRQGPMARRRLDAEEPGQVGELVRLRNTGERLAGDDEGVEVASGLEAIAATECFLQEADVKTDV